MKHSVSKYLEDVLISIADINNYIKDISSANELETKKVFFDAVCRRFAIIGEAIYQANKIDRVLNITDKKRIEGLRHVIVHDYDVVRANDLWLIIEDKLPVLNSEVTEILKDLE